LQVIDFELPITVQLTVVDADPGVKGDTAQGNAFGLSEILLSFGNFLLLTPYPYQLLVG